MKELAKKDMVEGEEAFERFDALVGKVMAVPRKEILRRDAAYKKRAAKNINKRGPKPKRRDVSRDLGAAPLS
ncbi:MAG: hypothetical protein JOY62_13960 [Acidobacteriaceae bacterium]|nr:hypothetical protein [Acidobacteriaceae bacterium]MBV9781067.1 hypothetical protein [Acidobacteriaceae bacterium]